MLLDPSRILEEREEEIVNRWIVEARSFIAGVPDERLRAVAKRFLDCTKEMLSPEEFARRAKAFDLRPVYVNLQAFLCDAIDARVPETEGHSRKVAKYAVEIARHMHLPESEIILIEEAALLHDIGKISIVAGIFGKRGKLTEMEFDQVKRHPQIGAEILRPIVFMQPHLPLVLHHHERWNGSGYPFGLKGEDIPLGARVIAVADVFDALSSPRPHRPAYSFQESLLIIQERSGVEFDPQVVNALREAYEDMFGRP